jgi:hypothetical protein
MNLLGITVTAIAQLGTPSTCSSCSMLAMEEK